MAFIKWIAPHRIDVFMDMLPIYVMDSNFGLLVFTWLLPGPLDPELLEDATSRALTYYPHFAGRLLGSDGWRSRLAAGSQVSAYIALTRTAIPITYSHSDLIPADDVMREFHPEIVDPVMCDVDHPPSPDEPLVKIKATTFSATGETSITFAFCHVLGDGLTFFRFTNLVSQLYCNDVPAQPLPTYDNYFRAPPSLPRSLVQDIARAYAPHLMKSYSPRDFMSICERSFTSTARVDVHFSLQEIGRFKAHACRAAGRNVSRQDALSAYLITALNRVRGPQIQQVINLVNYRGEGCSSDGYRLPDVTSSGSALLHVFSDIIPVEDTRNIGKVARVVSDTVRQVKDAEFIRQLVTTTTTIMGEVFGANRQVWWGAGENSVVLNNCYKLHHPSTHFGFKGQSRFYVNGSMERYIRIWAGNPVRLSDGTWQSNDGSADVSFRLEHELREPFLRLLAEDRQSWSGSAQVLSTQELSLLQISGNEFSRL